VTPQLRPYQQTLADEVRLAYRMGFQCPLVVASTGAGKTVLFSYITFHAAARGTPVIAAAHRKEIIRQISLSFAKFGIEHDVIAPQPLRRSIMAAQFKAFGRSFVKVGARVMVGSVQTLVTRFDAIDANLARAGGKAPLIIMDEGHHVVEDTQWGAVMERYHVNAGGRGLIVTASPQRLDGRGLGKGHGGFADTLIEAPPMTWLIENGYLSPYRAFTAPKQLDLQGVHTRMGDFVSSELAERVDKPSITGDAIAHWRQHANGMRAVAFCVSIEHSKHVAAEFNAAGIPAAHIDGAVDDSERDKAIIDFAAGRVLVLTNVNIVSEGFDLGSIAQADVTIDCLIDLSPTQSLVNFMQRAGRALRPAPGKVAVLLDHAGNIFRHGLPDEPREWSLEGVKRQKRQAKEQDAEGAVDRVMTCGKCFSIHLPAPACPTCGHVYPEKARRVEQEDGQLRELTSDQLEQMRRARRVLQGSAQTVDELVHKMGMSRSRAVKIVQAREAKAAQVSAVLDGIEQLGGQPYRLLGVTFGDIRRAKPKELAALQVRIGELLKDHAKLSEMRAA
jgi:DNA repair protein RadD